MKKTKEYTPSYSKPYHILLIIMQVIITLTVLGLVVYGGIKLQAFWFFMILFVVFGGRGIAAIVEALKFMKECKRNGWYAS